MSLQAPKFRRAIVTGGGRGIGRQIARTLRDNGWSVVITGRDAARLEAAAAELGASFFAFDVTNESEVAAAFRNMGAAELLVNCAGQAESAPFGRHSVELWNRMLAVNLTGAFYCIRAALPDMTQAGWGRIINIASTGGLSAYPYVAGYIAAKHGLIGLTRALATEFAGSGVTVNAVCPGFTRTDMYDEAVANVMAKTGRTRADAEAALVAKNPQGRVVEPEEIAAAVLWLASEAAASVNGQSIVLAGGEVM